MEKLIEKNTIVWIENLRAVSVIAVILLHVSAQMTYSFGKNLMENGGLQIYMKA